MPPPSPGFEGAQNPLWVAFHGKVQVVDHFEAVGQVTYRSADQVNIQALLDRRSADVREHLVLLRREPAFH